MTVTKNELIQSIEKYSTKCKISGKVEKELFAQYGVKRGS